MRRVATCACKNIEVTVEGDPTRVIFCHCDYCQRLSGSIGTLSAIFKEEDIVTVSGKTIIYEPPKWPGAELHFCSSCHTRVHWVNPGPFPGMHLIAGGCLVGQDLPSPDTVTQTKHRPSWCPEFEGAEHYEEYSGK